MRPTVGSYRWVPKPYRPVVFARMRIAVAGSIATDHLFTFEGRFADSLLVEQLSKISLSFLASDLQVRRGGTGANIAFGMGVLGHRPLLVGAVGKDAGDYLDVAAATTASTPRTSAVSDDEGDRPLHLHHRRRPRAARHLLPRRDGRGRRDRHRRRSASSTSSSSPRTTRARCCATPPSCRDRGVPFAADPSQQLAFMDGASIRGLVEGATYLFTNEYEAGARAREDRLERRRGARPGRHPHHHPRRRRHRDRAQGRADASRVAVAPAREVAEPTGVGDAFRAGFLTATAWGFGAERAAQVGALLATHVVETVGTQEYAFAPRRTSSTASPRPTATPPRPRCAPFLRPERRACCSATSRRQHREEALDVVARSCRGAARPARCLT